MKRHHWLILALLLVALAIRLAYWERSASFGRYELAYDDDEYFKLGVLFARGEFFTDPYPLRYTRAPGLPLFLAPIFAAFGPRIEIALAFQVCVSVLMVALTYACARRAFGKNAALWAMGLMALAPIYASTAGSFVLTETLFSFFTLLFLYLLWRWTDEGMTLWRALLIGLVLGLTALIRPSIIYFLPFAALWFLYKQRVRWKWAIPRLVLLALGAFAIILPYTARNYVVYQRFMLIDSLGGWNVWRDHRTPNDDFWTTLPTIENPSDRDRYAMQRGVQNILADPVYQIGVQGAANLVATMRLELDAFARGGGYLSDAMVDAPTLPLVLWNDLFYLFIVVVGIAGILLAWDRGNALRRTPLLWWLVFFLLLTILQHTQSRFRTQYAFVLIIYAGAALAQGRALWKNLAPAARAIWIGASALLLVLAYSPLLPPLFASEFYLAQAQGRDVRAAQQAVAAFPDYARARDALGDAYRRAQDFPNALAAYDAALFRNPYELQARLGRLDIFRQQGDANAVAQEIQAMTLANAELEMPAPLWWEFDPAPTRLVELGDNESSFGYALNFFAIQADGDEKMRFTRDKSFVKFPGVTGWQPKSLVFYARAVPLPNQPLPTVNVRLNGREVANIPLTAEWMDHEIPLDDVARSQDTLVVEFRSPTFRPSDALPGAKDTRELGFMLSYVELR